MLPLASLFACRFLESCERGEKENTIKFAIRVQNNIADALKIKTLTANKEDIDKWLKGGVCSTLLAPYIPICTFTLYSLYKHILPCFHAHVPCTQTLPYLLSLPLRDHRACPRDQSSPYQSSTKLINLQWVRQVLDLFHLKLRQWSNK